MVFQANTNICQLRLDFNTFNIAQPSMESSTDGTGIFNARPYTDRSVCTNDQFIVTSPGNPAPPVICGSNSLQHSKQARSRNQLVENIINDLISNIQASQIYLLVEIIMYHFVKK